MGALFQAAVIHMYIISSHPDPDANLVASSKQYLERTVRCLDQPEIQQYWPVTGAMVQSIRSWMFPEKMKEEDASKAPSESMETDKPSKAQAFPEDHPVPQPFDVSSMPMVACDATTTATATATIAAGGGLDPAQAGNPGRAIPLFSPIPSAVAPFWGIQSGYDWEEWDSFLASQLFGHGWQQPSINHGTGVQVIETAGQNSA